MRMFWAIGCVLVLGGCTIVPIDEDRDRRAQRGADFDASAFVERHWNSRIIPEIEQSAITVAALSGGKSAGRVASEGSATVYTLKDEAVVDSVDTASRTGSITLSTASGAQVKLLTGPVLVSSALRDALPFIDFNNFADQIAFASVNKALNARALKGLPSGLKPGDRIKFSGVASVVDPAAPLEILPVMVARAN